MWELIWISSATLWIPQLLTQYYLPKAKIAILLFRKQFQRLPVTKKAFCSCFLLTLEFFPWDVKSGVWRQKSGVYFDETEVRVFSKKNAVSQYFLVVFLVTKKKSGKSSYLSFWVWFICTELQSWQMEESCTTYSHSAKFFLVYIPQISFSTLF